MPPPRCLVAMTNRIAKELSGEAEPLHLPDIDPCAQKRNEVSPGRRDWPRQQFRQTVAQCDRDYHFRGRHARADGPQPGAELPPDQIGKPHGKVLQHSLCHATDLDEAMIGVDLAPDALPIPGRFPMWMLISRAAFERLHRTHPEMVSVAADDPKCRLEGDLDFAAPTVEPDDVDRIEAAIGAQEHAASPLRMDDQDKANFKPKRAPDQVDA